MMTALDTRAPALRATLNYLGATGKKPVTYQEVPGIAPRRYTEAFAPQEVWIADARPSAGEFTLDRQGFALVEHRSAVTDFYDDWLVRSAYYPEAETLIKASTGASRVVVFDHTVRVESEGTREARGVRAPARSVHNDYTERSGPQRVRDLLPDEAPALLAKRFAVINIWRPIVGPVRSAPIALADAKSVAMDDWVSTDLVYPDRVGEIYYLEHRPEHRWYYFSDMRPDEALLIKCYDSASDGRARFTAHTAFDLPSAPDAPPRESIELRTLAFFDEGRGKLSNNLPI